MYSIWKFWNLILRRNLSVIVQAVVLEFVYGSSFGLGYEPGIAIVIVCEAWHTVKIVVGLWPVGHASILQIAVLVISFL